MKTIAILFFVLLILSLNAQNRGLLRSFEKSLPEQRFSRLPFGAIKPTGWLKTQMERDMQGFVGQLDQLVPDLFQDSIYGVDRLHEKSEVKELGNAKEGDAEGDEQYQWWNSETQSNWWDAFLRHAILLNDRLALAKVEKRMGEILATQDTDGYLGIYSPGLRYRFSSENGELWAKTTLLRGMLAYYEYTEDVKIWNAIRKAVDNTMLNYPAGKSSPFDSGDKFNGGVSHGLTFTDVLDRLHQITGEKEYLDYAAFLYMDFSKTFQSEKDAQLTNILDPKYQLQCHGVHTYEHLRPLIAAYYATGTPKLKQALKIYLNRIEAAVTVAGGPIGDEWISGRAASASETGYEYCSIHELLDSYTVLLQKKGDPETAEKIENIFYNAAQGARHPEHSCIAYLKTDNSFEMLGTKNGEAEPGRKQTRYKYSPAHQDVAVCCAPNAGRITPYFLQASWMKEGENTLAATLLAPNRVETTIAGAEIAIETKTAYPTEQKLQYRITTSKPVKFTLKIRKPDWASKVICTERYRQENGYLIFNKEFPLLSVIDIEFKTQPRVIESPKEEFYFAYGAQIYALPIEAEEEKGRSYGPEFLDRLYRPTNPPHYIFTTEHLARHRNGILEAGLFNETTGEVERVNLVPLAQTILRQASF